MKIHRTLIHSALLLACGLVCGCKQKEAVEVYSIPKPEVESATGESPAMGAPAETGTAAGQASVVTGNVPANWEAQPLTEMRQASYLVKGESGATADISLVSLPGAAGGVLENINRWMSQLGKPAITEEQLAQTAQQVASPLGDVTVVDIEGLPQGADAAKDGRIIGGIASTGDKTYFFKMRGNAALTEAQKEDFIRWIGSVKVPGATSNTAEEGVFNTGPVTMTAPPAAAEKPQIKWEVPEGWKTVPATSMRYASFAFTGGNGETADISVVVFDGEGGGNLENVNRWRGQAGLEAIGDAELKTLVVPVACKDGEIETVDLAGPKARILAGWARNGGKTWFFKLSAPDKLAAAQKTVFAKFLQSVEFQP